jgi:hypothetical protein
MIPSVTASEPGRAHPEPVGTNLLTGMWGFV